MPFSGVCMFTETASDGTPCGSDKPVAFSREATEKALDSFIGMGVNCTYYEWGAPEYSLTGHDMRFKIGVVEEAKLNNDGQVEIKGHLWKSDFYDVCYMIKNAKDSLGFSVEVVISDMEERSDFYFVNDFTFTGVAILYKNLAAFKDTQLAAQRKNKQQKESDVLMNEEQFTKFMETMGNMQNAITELGNKVDALATKEPEKMDFTDVINAINGLKPEQAELAKATEDTPKPKTTFEGKQQDEKPFDYKVMCQEVDNDVNIPIEKKAYEKLRRYMEHKKAQ